MLKLIKDIYLAILIFSGNKPKPLTIREKVIQMAESMKHLYGLRYLYVVCDPSGNGSILSFRVKEFHRDHFELLGGAIYPYESLGGYFIAPEVLIQQLRAKESGLTIAKVH